MTGTALAFRTRVKGIYFVATAVAGSIVLRDGGAGGAVELELDTPAIAGTFYAELPEQGILFNTDVHITLTNVSSATLFYA